jgi:hypothetical protein
LILQVYLTKVWKAVLLLVLKAIVLLHAALVRKILCAAALAHAPMGNVCVCLTGREPTVASLLQVLAESLTVM